MRRLVVGAAAWSILGLAGCVNVQVPEIPESYGGRPAPRVDSSRVPKTRTHDECRVELNRAYEYIGSLERRNQRLENDKDKLKAEVKQLKNQLKASGKRYDD